jgi:GDP-L-fucose synthase
MLACVVGYEGEVRWDASKPDGTPRKLLDSSRLLAQGWRAEVPLEEGIRATYAWYLANPDLIRSITLG